MYTRWWGASPENIELYITSVIESELCTIPGVRNIYSNSYDGYSYITIDFLNDIKMDFAYLYVNEALYGLYDKLPKDATYPSIERYMPEEFEEDAFLSLGIYSEELTKIELTELIKKQIKPVIANIEGVSGLELRGIAEEEINIIFDYSLLKSLNISLLKNIIPVIHEYRDIYSIGSVSNEGKQYLLIIQSDRADIDKIKNIQITNDRGRTFSLSEIASVKWELSKQKQSDFRLNGNNVVNLRVYREPGSNLIALTKKIKLKMNSLISEKEFKLLNLAVLEDKSEDIKHDFTYLLYRIIFVVLIMFLVLLVFIRKLKPTIIVLLTILFEVLITINVLYFGKQSLNYFSLTGLALAFGLLVDNAIVVYENIHRYEQKGTNLLKGLKNTINEIKWSVIAATLTTICVFIPFIYLQRDIKVLLLPFAITVGVALLSSIFVSFTFIPIALNIKGKNLTTSKNNQSLQYSSNNLNEKRSKSKLSLIYKNIIDFLLHHRIIPITIAALILFFAINVFIYDVDKEKFFRFEFPDYISIFIRPPANTKFETVDNIVKSFEDVIDQAQSEKIKYFQSFITPSQAIIKIYFPEDILETSFPYILREKLVIQSKCYAGIYMRVWGLGPLFYGGGEIFYHNFELGGYNYYKLKEITTDFAKDLRKSPHISNVRTFSSKGRQIEQINIKPRQDILKNYSLNKYQITTNLFYLLNKLRINRVTFKEEEYYVRLCPQRDFDLNELKSLILNIGGKNFKLKEIADIELFYGPYSIQRENQEYKVKIEYEYRGSYEKHMLFRENIIKYKSFPEGYRFIQEKEELTGFKSIIKEKGKVIFIISLTIIIIFIILAVLFESYIQPFVIMITIPLAFVGVSFTFAIFDLTFDSSAFIGCLLLCGIVVNNSIILVNRINQVRKKNTPLNAAILKAAQERVRPILITSITTILGLLPFILYTADTSSEDIWNLLAFATIGGLTTSTLFTLFFIPVFYNIFEKIRKL